MKNPKYTFCRELNWDILKFLYEDDVIIVTLLVLRTQ